VDALNGELYGHIIAGDPLTGLAFITPAHTIFSDIKRRFGKEAWLPTEDIRESPSNIAPHASKMPQPPDFKSSNIGIRDLEVGGGELNPTMLAENCGVQDPPSLLLPTEGADKEGLSQSPNRSEVGNLCMLTERHLCCE
jgi:hypothetical protein